MSKSMLLKADEVIHGERVKLYGPATETFNRVANAFTLITKKELSGADVALLQIIFKLVRNSYSPENPDHLLDMLGYGGILADIQEAKYQQGVNNEKN